MSGLALLGALAAVTVLVGIWAVVGGLRRTPATGSGAGRVSRDWRRMKRASADASKRTRVLAAAGVVLGVLIWLASGWLLAIVVAPVAMAGIPILLAPTGEAARIARLEAMEEWTRVLSGVLTVGVGLEQAIIATLRSTPQPIRTEVVALVARLRARWSTEAALHAFADDLDDATGDQIAASLLLGSMRRGSGLASVLEGLAQTVAEDVRNRRAVEADRAKPRSAARWITIITLVVLCLLALDDDYVAPYRTGVGELLLSLLLSAYVVSLIWLRTMTRGEAPPRFIGCDLVRTRPSS